MGHPISIVAGAIFGFAAGLLLLFNGRIAGVSGVAAGLLSPRAGDLGWRICFIAGLLAGGAVIGVVLPTAVSATHWVGPSMLVIAGLLIGLGARLGNGCTSGHGVCGVGRFS